MQFDENFCTHHEVSVTPVSPNSNSDGSYTNGWAKLNPFQQAYMYFERHVFSHPGTRCENWEHNKICPLKSTKTFWGNWIYLVDLSHGKQLSFLLVSSPENPNPFRKQSKIFHFRQQSLLTWEAKTTLTKLFPLQVYLFPFSRLTS